MNKLRFKLLIVFCICLTACISISTNAQNSTSSPYSMFGLGDIETIGSIRSSGMGSAGLALSSSTALNPLNPASFTGIDSMFYLFDIGVAGKHTDLETKSNQESNINANINSILFGFRAKSWWAMSFGLLPYSTIGYKFDALRQIEGTTTNYINTIEGTGGINKFYVANAFRWKNLSLGVNVSYLFGNLSVTETNKIQLNGTNYTAYTDRSYYLNNFYFDYGLQYRFKIKRGLYSIGATYAHKQTLSSEFNTKTYLETGEELDNQENNSNKITIPQSAGIGFAFQIPEKLTVAADYSIQDWSDNTFSQPVVRFNQTQNIRFGIEFNPDRSIGKSYFNFVDYRIGAYYSDLYYELYNIPISEQGVSIGFGFPLRSLTKLDVSFEYGTKGTTTSGLVKESFFKIKLGLTLRQIWFQRIKYQ